MCRNGNSWKLSEVCFAMQKCSVIHNLLIIIMTVFDKIYN